MDMKRKPVFIAILLWFVSLSLSAGIIVVGDMTHEREVSPGMEYSGSIVINNADGEENTVILYQTDYEFFADGRIYYNDPGKIPRSNANWMVISPKRITIPPNETVTVNYTVKVPVDDTMTGTYWSVIMVEGLGKVSDNETEPAEIGLGLRQQFRYAIQVVTHMGASGNVNVRFSGAALTKENDKPVLYIDVENIGERWVRSALWSELYSSAGAHAGKIDAGRLRIYPGTSVRYRLDLSAVPVGQYKATVVLDCGNNNVYGAHYNLVLE